MNLEEIRNMLHEINKYANNSYDIIEQLDDLQVSGGKMNLIQRIGSGALAGITALGATSLVDSAKATTNQTKLKSIKSKEVKNFKKENIEQKKENDSQSFWKNVVNFMKHPEINKYDALAAFEVLGLATVVSVGSVSLVKYLVKSSDELSKTKNPEEVCDLAQKNINELSEDIKNGKYDSEGLKNIVPAMWTVFASAYNRFIELNTIDKTEKLSLNYTGNVINNSTEYIFNNLKENISKQFGESTSGLIANFKEIIINGIEKVKVAFDVRKAELLRLEKQRKLEEQKRLQREKEERERKEQEERERRISETNSLYGNIKQDFEQKLQNISTQNTDDSALKSLCESLWRTVSGAYNKLVDLHVISGSKINTLCPISDFTNKSVEQVFNELISKVPVCLNDIQNNQEEKFGDLIRTNINNIKNTFSQKRIQDQRETVNNDANTFRENLGEDEFNNGNYELAMGHRGFVLEFEDPDLPVGESKYTLIDGDKLNAMAATCSSSVARNKSAITINFDHCIIDESCYRSSQIDFGKANIIFSNCIFDHELGEIKTDGDIILLGGCRRREKNQNGEYVFKENGYGRFTNTIRCKNFLVSDATNIDTDFVSSAYVENDIYSPVTFNWVECKRLTCTAESVNKIRKSCYLHCSEIYFPNLTCEKSSDFVNRIGRLQGKTYSDKKVKLEVPNLCHDMRSLKALGFTLANGRQESLEELVLIGSIPNDTEIPGRIAYGVKNTSNGTIEITPNTQDIELVEEPHPIENVLEFLDGCGGRPMIENVGN